MSSKGAQVAWRHQLERALVIYWVWLKQSIWFHYRVRAFLNSNMQSLWVCCPKFWGEERYMFFVVYMVVCSTWSIGSLVLTRRGHWRPTRRIGDELDFFLFKKSCIGAAVQGTCLVSLVFHFWGLEILLYTKKSWMEMRLSTLGDVGSTQPPKRGTNCYGTNLPPNS